MLKILSMEGKVQVSKINKWIAIKQSALSQHLKVLHNAGLIDTRKTS